MSVFISISIGHSRFADFLREFIPQDRDRFGFSFHQELDHFLEENALEFLESARLERAAFDHNFAFASEKGVVLSLVAEHGLELFVELDFDPGSSSQPFAQIFNFCGSVAAFARRRAEASGGRKAAWKAALQWIAGDAGGTK